MPLPRQVPAEADDEPFWSSARSTNRCDSPGPLVFDVGTGSGMGLLATVATINQSLCRAGPNSDGIALTRQSRDRPPAPSPHRGHCGRDPHDDPGDHLGHHEEPERGASGQRTDSVSVLESPTRTSGSSTDRVLIGCRWLLRVRDQPISESEIKREIERQSGGYWRLARPAPHQCRVFAAPKRSRPSPLSCRVDKSEEVSDQGPPPPPLDHHMKQDRNDDTTHG